MPQQPTALQWEQHKALITDFYIGQNMTQKEVASVMRSQYDFYATEKMFVSRFLQWGINKKMTMDDATAILQAARRRTDRGRNVLKIRLRGREVTANEAEVSLRRRKAKVSASPRENLPAPSTPSNISIVCEDEDGSDYALELDDQQSAILLANAAVRQRPDPPALVGDERLEVFFIRKLRDWHEASKEDSSRQRSARDSELEESESPGLSDYFEDLKDLMLSQTTQQNRRLWLTLHQLGPILDHELSNNGYYMLRHLFCDACICSSRYTRAEHLARVVRKSFLQAGWRVAGGLSEHPLWIVCSLLFGDGAKKSVGLLARPLSVQLRKSFGLGSNAYLSVEEARSGFVSETGDARGAISVLESLSDVLRRGSHHQRMLARYYRCRLGWLHVQSGNVKTARSIFLSSLEHCCEVSQERGVPMAGLDETLVYLYDQALHGMAYLSYVVRGFEEEERWLRDLL